MAFLYRTTVQDAPGQFGAVRVGDEKPLQVVSVGQKGSYAQSNFREALGLLQAWLKSHREWDAAGPPRVLAYNSPFMLFWRKYSEVQIPVGAAALGGRNTPPVSAAKSKSTSSLSGNATVNPMAAALPREQQAMLVNGPVAVHRQLLWVPR